MKWAVLPVGQSGRPGVAAPVMSSSPAMPESPIHVHVCVSQQCEMLAKVHV